MTDDTHYFSNSRDMTKVDTIGDLVESRISRRAFVGGGVAASAVAMGGCAAPAPENGVESVSQSSFSFAEIARGVDGTHHVPDGYIADVLIRWGDPVFPDSPSFDPANQTSESQHKQFGQSNDFIGFVALPPEADGADRALLCVNHEYTKATMMFPGVAPNYPASMTKTHCETEMAAHGGSIIEIRRREDDGWDVLQESHFNRRVTAATTPMTLTGPAAGHDRMKTSEDPDGLTVSGTVNNCAGGITPWNTYLMAEENLHGYFIGDLPENHPETRNHKRYNVGGSPRYVWGRFFDRYDLGKEPNEPNRFGWIVEVDPLDPTSTPKKRTALGRTKHEGAESVIAPSGRVVVYSGDDERFDYLYKFVSKNKFVEGDRKANMSLLDEGVLYVARFNESGTVDWLPLTFGHGLLTPENDFHSQADVLIETRRAADLLEATPMDRPEDVEPDPRTGRVWVMLTNNHLRTEDQVNAANPRSENRFGHIIEIIEPNGDFTAKQSRWEFLVKCGDPDDPSSGAMWNAQTSANGWFGSPDNCAIDPSGRLWVATDGNPATGANDGLWAMETKGEMRGTGRAFFRSPVGAEVTGPRFSDDGRTLFIAVQHPGDSNGATFENPSTRWPDFDPAMTARSAVLAIRKKDGGVIGS
ncbi:PhoX family phosphatase [Hyphococcus flavus]|uniref:PhoX family phosphatase n=1 Tax=Hyphococcus flavus TaxID=1866326 RepID=A0AAF0CFM2_9PROT|nr:PhoX family phosphatase [Hyphococcus flavus]WDI31123.1 PhoX family phosphatase [Hyphococcus flavus]